jgi:hypothetical protein
VELAAGLIVSTSGVHDPSRFLIFLVGFSSSIDGNRGLPPQAAEGL